MKQIKMTAIILAMLPFFSFTTLKNVSSFPFAKVSWVKELHDFGEIPKGKPVSIEFSFTNTGDEPLLVADVVTSCGCTASDYSREPIAPGKSSKVKVTFNAATAGAFSKDVTVNFHEAALKKVLNIKGTVK